MWLGKAGQKRNGHGTTSMPRRAKSQRDLTCYYRSFMKVTYFTRSCSHLPMQDLGSLYLHHSTPIHFFMESPRGISDVLRPGSLLFSPLCYDSRYYLAWVLLCLSAPLPVSVSSVALAGWNLPLNTSWFTKDSVAPPRSHLHCYYVPIPLQLRQYSQTLKVSGLVTYNGVTGSRGYQGNRGVLQNL